MLRQAGSVGATFLVGAAVAEMLHWLQKIVLKRSKGPDLLPHPADHARLTKTISEVNTLLTDIEIGPHIGAGTFGKVYKGQSPSVGLFCTVSYRPDPCLWQYCAVLGVQLVSKIIEPLTKTRRTYATDA